LHRNQEATTNALLKQVKGGLCRARNLREEAGGANSVDREHLRAKDTWQRSSGKRSSAQRLDQEVWDAFRKTLAHTTDRDHLILASLATCHQESLLIYSKALGGDTNEFAAEVYGGKTEAGGYAYYHFQRIAEEIQRGNPDGMQKTSDLRCQTAGSGW
jgi:hypothetical protein